MSVNIKTDYGAVGDGQIATVNATFTSGSNNLTVFFNIFVASDIGKYIAVQNWIVPTGANPAGVNGSAAATSPNTIASISVPWNGTSMTIVLGGSAAVQSQVATSSKIEWGSDDTPAFAAFNAAQVGQSNITLVLPAGRYIMVTGGGGGSLAIGAGMAPDSLLTVNGSGSPVLSDMLGGGAGPVLGFNGAPLYNDNTAESLVQTVSAGSTSITCITHSDAGKYTANTWAWLTGYDTQGFGSPPNPQWAEFVFVTGVDASTGVVSFNAPLKNSYKSTWPAWVLGSPGTGAPNYTGGAFSLGGPATLYLLKSDAWNLNQIWNGVSFAATPTLMNCGIKNITINNANFETFSANCSFNLNFTVTGSTVPTLWELDKVTDTCVIQNCTLHGLFGPQSPSPYNVTIDTCNITNIWQGSSNHWIVTNCTMPVDPGMGSTAYGAITSFTGTTNTYQSQTFQNLVQETSVTTTGAWSCSGGLMSRTKSAGSGEPPQWCVPGSYFALSQRYSFINPVWKCLDVYESAGTLFIQTDQTGGFPSGVNGDSDIFAITAPALVNFSGCIGSDDALSLSNIGLHRYQTKWDLTYTGDIGSSDVNPAHLIKVSGTPIFVRITVISAYTGGLLKLDPFVIAKPSNFEVSWLPVIDLTTTGVRTITPSGVTGSTGSDSALAFPNSGSVWLVSNQITPFMTGVSGSGSVRIEIQTDMGFPTGVVPLRFRLHS
jgi:hypothetical protein